MNQPAPMPPQPVTKSGGCVKGCFIGAAILVVLLGIGGYFLAHNIGGLARNLSSTALNTMTDQFLQQSKLPPAEKTKIEAIIKGFSQQVKDGHVSLEQGVKIMQSIVAGPVFSNIAAESFKVAYLQKSGLSHDELEAGTETVGRFMHGVMTEGIPKEEADGVLNLFSSPGSTDSGSRQFKQSLSDGEVRTILARMKSDADAAKIEPTPQQIDIATELQKAIAQGMTRK